MNSKTIWIIVAVIALVALVYYFCWEPADAVVAAADQGGAGGASSGGGYGGTYPLGDTTLTTIATIAGPAPNSSPGLTTSLGLGSGGPQSNASGIGGLIKPRQKSTARHL